MQISLFVAVLSFFGLVAMVANKLWHIKTGKIEEPYNLHLLGPIARAAHVHSLRAMERAGARIRPTVVQAKKDMMLLGYEASATLAKRFAKIANEIKGKGELPDSRSGSSFMLAYAQKENGADRS